MLMVFLNGEVMRLRDKYDRMYVPCKMTPEDWNFFTGKILQNVSLQFLRFSSISESV